MINTTLRDSRYAKKVTIDTRVNSSPYAKDVTVSLRYNIKDIYNKDIKRIGFLLYTRYS